MRIAIIGRGRMGQELARLATEKGYLILRQCSRPDATFWEEVSDAVVIDFSHASQVPLIVKECLERRLPLITGTTGWSEKLSELHTLAQAYSGARWLWGSNFSRGIAVLKAILHALTPLQALLSDWDAALIEMHHRHKKDAPSGTAIELQKHFPSLRAIHSLRIGELIGEHELILSGSGEEIRLLHRAHSRQVFAEGALWAAQWLLSKDYFVGPFEEIFFSGQ